MNQQMTVTYYLHSGFSCAMGGIICIFDYWLGEYQELPESARITAPILSKYDEVYVFVTHSHPDHFDRVIYDWSENINVTYIISDELPEEAQGNRMKPGEELQLSEKVHVKAFSSTDLGVSFLVTIDGIPVFHAGDLNYWHWREESTTQQINEAYQEFHSAIRELEGQNMEVAFFPVDPRQGRLFEAGANTFMMTCKPKLLIPMHFWQRNELISEYVRRSQSANTSIYAMLKSGDRILLSFEDHQLRYMDVFDNQPIVKDELDNPFYGTDLPLDV